MIFRFETCTIASSNPENIEQKGINADFRDVQRF